MNKKMMKLGCSCNANFIRRIYFFRRFPMLYSTSTSSSSIKQGNNNNTCTFAKFLVESLGFSNHQSLATSAKLVKWRHKDNSSKVIDSKFVDNARSVIHFFKQLGFPQSDIRQLFCLYPQYLCFRVDKTLKPKIQLLLQVGVSESDLFHALLRNPSLLSYQCLGSAIHALRVVLGTDYYVVSVLKRSIFINFKGVADNLIPNVELLQTCYGIPTDNVRRFVFRQPNMFIMRSELFRDMLIKVEHKFGIPRDSAMFLYGIHLLSFCKEKKLEDKCAVFKSFGWNQSDVLALIRQNPLCLLSSEGRIKERLDFLMNQLGYKPNYLASKPSLFTYSLEKRLLPRHRVLEVLKEKGLCRMDYSLSTLARLPESRFLKRFVLPFEEVHQVYVQLTGCKIGLDTAEIAKGQL